MLDLAAINRLHNTTTLFHAFIYFAPEAGEEYAAAGVEGQGPGYFGSRSAAMGQISPEMAIATFYNFSPDYVTTSLNEAWSAATARELQAARWRAVAQVLDATVAPVMPEDAIAEAIGIAEVVVANLPWSGRPLAAANAAVMRDLDAAGFSASGLVALWQLVTVLREWRGDAHIGLLVAEPLDGAECTVVSEAVAGLRPGAIRGTRVWSDADWSAAIDRLRSRGWVNADGSITEHGRHRRAAIEERTNELSQPMWSSVGDDAALRLDELLTPGRNALLDANYFAAIGRPAKK